MIDSPRIPWTLSLTSFFFSFNSHKNFKPCFDWFFFSFFFFPLFPTAVSPSYKNNKNNKANIPVMPGEVLFRFYFHQCQNTTWSSFHSPSRARRFFLHAFLVRDVLLEDFLLCLSVYKYVFYDIYECDQSGNMLSVWAGCSQTWSHCDQNFQFWGWLIHQLGSINWQGHRLWYGKGTWRDCQGEVLIIWDVKQGYSFHVSLPFLLAIKFIWTAVLNKKIISILNACYRNHFCPESSL